MTLHFFTDDKLHPLAYSGCNMDSLQSLGKQRSYHISRGLNNDGSTAMPGVRLQGELLPTLDRRVRLQAVPERMAALDRDAQTNHFHVVRPKSYLTRAQNECIFGPMNPQSPNPNFPGESLSTFAGSYTHRGYFFPGCWPETGAAEYQDATMDRNVIALRRGSISHTPLK